MSRRSNPAEELLRRTAHRETFRNVAHQLQCLKRRYNVLYGVNADTASSSNNHHHHPKNRAFILRKLKYALRTQYEDCFPLPPPNRCSVLLLFDTNEEAFFEIRLKPKAWPEDWPTRFDCGSAGIDMELLSGAIYMKVLEAFNEEAENGGTGDVLSEPSRAFGVVSRSSSGGGTRSSVVEENRLTRVIVKSEEEEIVISDEENNDQQQQIETAEEDRMDYNNMLQEGNLAGRPRREGSGSSPSSATVNHNHNNDNSNGSSSQQRPFSNTVKPEPTANSSSSILINTQRRPLESTSTLRHSPPPPPPPSAAAAAAAAARAPRTRASNRALPDASASASAPTFYLLNSLCSPAEMTAAISRFTASSAYQSARARTRLPCPLCEKPITKFTLTDHLNAVHLGRRRYHCAWPDGCAKAFGHRGDCQKHLRRAHQSTEYERYLQVRE